MPMTRLLLENLGSGARGYAVIAATLLMENEQDPK